MYSVKLYPKVVFVHNLLKPFLFPMDEHTNYGFYKDYQYVQSEAK